MLRALRMHWPEYLFEAFLLMACAKIHHSSKMSCIFCGFEPKPLEVKP